MMQDVELLTVSHAARALQVAANTLRLWERQGKLPALRTTSGVRLFDRRDIDRLIAERLRAK